MIQAEHGPAFILDRYPYPPSQNHLFPTNRRTGRRFKSAEYVRYERDVGRWAELNRNFLREVTEEFLPFIGAGHLVRVDSLYCLPRSDIFTKKGAVKKSDAANRLKAQYDTLSLHLGIDDLYFYPGPTRKAVWDEGEPCVLMKLTLTTVPTRQQAIAMLREGASW